MLDSSHNANARVFYSIGKILSDLSFADLFIDGSQIKDIVFIMWFHSNRDFRFVRFAFGKIKVDRILFFNLNK